MKDEQRKIKGKQRACERSYNGEDMDIQMVKTILSDNSSTTTNSSDNNNNNTTTTSSNSTRSTEDKVKEIYL